MYEYRYKVTTEPTVEPITLDEAKLHLRVTDTAQDDLITGVIKSARQFCESYENVKYITQTITYKLDDLCDPIRLPVGDAQSITSVKYLDEDEVEQTLSSSLYLLDNYSSPNLIYAKNDVEYPTVLSQRNAVTVVYIAGYGLAADVPERIKTAMKLLVSHLYEHRENDSEIKLEKMPTNAKSFLHEREF